MDELFLRGVEIIALQGAEGGAQAAAGVFLEGPTWPGPLALLACTPYTLAPPCGCHHAAGCTPSQLWELLAKGTGDPVKVSVRRALWTLLLGAGGDVTFYIPG